MRKTVPSILFAFTALLSFSSHAQEFYIGGGITNWNISEDDFSDLSSTGLSFRAGLEMNENISLETHLTTGGSDRQRYDDGVTEKFELDSILSGFVKAKIPVSEQARFYGLVGLSRIRMSVSADDGFDASGSETNVAAGLGAEFDVSSNFYISGDFIRHSLDESLYDFDTLSLTGMYRF